LKKLPIIKISKNISKISKWPENFSFYWILNDGYIQSCIKIFVDMESSQAEKLKFKLFLFFTFLPKPGVLEIIEKILLDKYIGISS